ncbi:hypothetical protein ZWY2020_054181 [Hordeum vulgare]|nr:hypothetical protein ZWY2020_054181 [Hordeum vulgare]
MADDGALGINVEAGEVGAAVMRSGRWVECMVCTIGLATASMSAASAIYKAPTGIFAGHGCAYYSSVVSAGVIGLAEACAAAVWLSAGVGMANATDGRRQLLARRCVLCASFLPLAFMAGLGGLRLLVK